MRLPIAWRRANGRSQQPRRGRRRPKRVRTLDRIYPDAQYRPAELAELESVCLATIYLRLARGEYAPVYKDGRATLIPGAAILARRAAKLKPAKFKAPRPPAPARFHTISADATP
jgi:hypothetical protein